MFILETFVFMMTEEMSQFEASLLLFFFLVLWSLGGSGAVCTNLTYHHLHICHCKKDQHARLWAGRWM